MEHHVLVPIDDSDPAWAALEFACENHPEAILTAIHVLDPAETGLNNSLTGTTSEEFESGMKMLEERAADLFERATEIAASYDHTLQTETVNGKPARSIVAFTEERNIDHIVIGSHGRRGVSRLLLGSVAETVTRRATVPVTIVR